MELKSEMDADACYLDYLPASDEIKSLSVHPVCLLITETGSSIELYTILRNSAYVHLLDWLETLSFLKVYDNALVSLKRATEWSNHSETA
jgi:hypothetical protein